MGFVLADIPHRLTWRALIAWMKHAPKDSAFYLYRHGEPAKWGDQEYMTAIAVDYLALLAWMQTKDGHKNRRRPDRLPRPGEKPTETRMGNAHMSIAQAKKWLGW